ncbi:alpha-galactosidase [bacterium]|nr:alpha-galactosidase [bacterium]
MNDKGRKEAIRQIANWASYSFTGRKLYPPPVNLKLLRQDFALLKFGESCMDTPIKIGKKEYAHGLGTHANSEIVVDVPRGARIFKAFVGIDNNQDTQGKRGSVVFSVETDGRELVKTPVLKGGDEPFLIEIPLTPDISQLILKVDTTPDGPGWDQADWADAQFIMSDKRIIWLDEGQNDLILMESPTPPFSFFYNDVPSSSFINNWQRTVEKKDEKDWIFYRVSWLDPDTKLLVEADVKIFRDFPAVEWVLFFENKGDKKTPIIRDIQAIDTKLVTGNLYREAVLHHLHGDSCDENSFFPMDTSLPIDRSIRIAPTGGRPSSISGFPFMNFQYAQRGVILAIGWTGQWCVSFERPKSQTCETHLKAGMELTHLSLYPGERIRTPRILIMTWKGDRWDAHNLFRRLLLAHYVPQINGKVPELPIALQTFDRYNFTLPRWATEEGQLEAVRAAYKIGCDTYWFDAGWFVGDFPNGVGNWFPKPHAFPRGLKPISDLCHKLSMKFVLWVEPERVAPGTQIAREHPEWVFGGENGGLFKLNDPSARHWLTELLCKIIDDFGLDIYRNDFNIDPLPFWRANDEPDRQGITEIRYVEGLYEMWDEILRRHPGLMIDNCASGGRRIDLETIMRSVPLWRSDTGCFPGHPEWNQNQSMGLAQYIPLFSVGVWSPEPYEFRSAQTAGAICEWAYLEDGFPWELARKMVVEAKENRKFWLGDFYPLTPASKSNDQLIAYQLHRSDLKEGIIYAFRRPECEYFGLIVPGKAISPDATYRLEMIDDSLKKTRKIVKGEKLLNEGLEIRLPKKRSSLVIRYKEITER